MVRFGLPALLILAACLGVSDRAVATEGALVEYPIGVNTVSPAFVPPPGGSVYLNYLQGYSASKFAGPNGRSAVPGFHVNVIAEVQRFLHTWNVAWRGLTFTSGVAQPVLYQSVRVPGRRQSSFEAGDTVIQPLYLTATVGDLHLLAGSDIWVPNGQYDRRDIANAGLNYWSFGLEQAVTWTPSPALEASVNLITTFRTRNGATRYQSGNDFVLDYDVGYRPDLTHMPQLQLAVQGYAYTQWTDDSIDGHVVNGGNRGRAFAIGPQVRYDIGHGGIVLKWQHEFAVKNRPDGERFWLQFAVPF